MARFLLFTFLMIQAALAQASDFEWDEAPSSTAVSSLEQTSGLKVFWWNIHGGRITSEPAPYLSRNLITLIHSKIAPDMIAFAEYGDASLSEDALRELRRAYPYIQEWNYPYANDYGLALYSRYPFENTKMEALDVTPLKDISESQRSDYRKYWCGSDVGCTRMFASFNVNVNGKIIQLVPTHLFDIWRKFGEVKGKVATAEEILVGKNNPLEYQLIRFRALLDSQLAAALTSPTIVIGDFNIPKYLMGLHPRMYNLLKGDMEDVSSFNPTTFPAKSADERNHYPLMNIDHAFLAGQIQSSKFVVLPLKGSDHYPLYLIVN